MSFKRSGDDLSVLNILKHQRVSNLLESHIPDDEAKLLSNGRLTCTVCFHRPIFDTVPMLAKHRKGKKHILELSRFIKRKEELEMAALKKQQFESIKIEMDIQSIISSRPLLGCGGREYSSSDRTRRKTLQLSTFSPKKKHSLIPDIPSPRSSACKVRRYLKTLHKKRSLDSLVYEKRENYGGDNNIVKVEAPSDNKTLPDIRDLQPSTEKVHQSTTLADRADKEFSLNLSGWIKDKDGKWVKDPDAEFDSDEEAVPNEV